MIKARQYRRLFSLALLLGVAFAGLGYRLLDLQVLRHDELSNKAQANTQKTFQLEPKRGDILDAKGQLLATSIFVKTVCADPSLLGTHQKEVACALASVLDMEESNLLERLNYRFRQVTNNVVSTNLVGVFVTNRVVQTVTNKYVVLKRKVPVETWQKASEVMSKISFGIDESKLPKGDRRFYQTLRSSAVFTEPMDDQLRVYPNQTLAAHVLGFVGTEEHVQTGHRIVQTSGREGIELQWNAKLSGVRGWRQTEIDRKAREMVALREQNVEPRDGLNTVLTIDSVIQHILETALDEAMDRHSPISISGMVVRPKTGEILAMATMPTFDPNSPGEYSADARRNRIITDISEPGSTFKIVVVSAALSDKVVKLSDVFNCENGRFSYGGKILKDHESYGALSVENIITKSSNIGTAKIALMMGNDKVYQLMRNFGFGARTGITLPGEVQGQVHPVKDWTKISIVQIPMGQGVAVTSIQMMMAMSAIANDGWLMRPMLVSHLQNQDGEIVTKYYPQRVRQLVSEKAANEMITALKTVVATNGTAAKAMLEHYTVAGKTGTAQKAGRGGYMPGKYFSSFIGFFPADDPELCISIVMDEPKQGYYGGQTAAPVFKQVAEKAANYLNIRPDIENDPFMPDTIAATNSIKTIRTASARSR